MDHGLETWRAFLHDSRKLVNATSPLQLSGRLTRINGLVMEASGLKLPLGSGCRIVVPGVPARKKKRLPRASGVLLHPTSLPGPHGSGDFGREAYHFVDWLVAGGQTLWQILPLGGIGPGRVTGAAPFLLEHPGLHLTPADARQDGLRGKPQQAERQGEAQQPAPVEVFVAS